MKKNLFWARIMVLFCAVSLGNVSFAGSSNQVTEDPTAAAMAVDAVLVRPLMMAITTVGAALWVVALPFSAAGGNIKASGETLVVGPAKTTFVRCLGCTKPGYQKD